MNDTLHRTDTLGSCKTVICGKQKMHWIEFQLLDEQGEPLAYLPYRACNEATRSDFIPEYSGRTDVEGVIRMDGLHPLAITLQILDGLKQPGLLLHAPAGIGVVSPEAVSLSSGSESVGIVAAHNVDLSAGQNITATAEDGISLLAHSADMQLKAA
ncbi:MULTISPECIES: DUF2345 domain-containing protein, partial [unclassified Pseudomonas]